MLNWLRSAFDRATGSISSTIAGWVHDVVAGLYSFLHVIFGGIDDAWKDFTSGLDTLGSAIAAFGSSVAHDMDLLFLHWIPGIISWVTRVVWALAKEAWDWITHEGATIWHYITHPADLVDLIWEAFLAKLEATAWDTADYLGKFAIALVWKNIDKFLALIEDVLDAIL
jgi:phage-related protein